MILGRYNKDNDRPPPCKTRFLTEAEPFSTAKELGSLGMVFDQDFSNFKAMTKGMKAAKNKQVILANYQENRIRHFNKLVDKYVGYSAAPRVGSDYATK